MEKITAELDRVAKMICPHRPDSGFFSYTHRANHHIARMSKSGFIQLGLNYDQNSNTPTLRQHDIGSADIL
jgi:hypothetical protein